MYKFESNGENYIFDQDVMVISRESECQKDDVNITDFQLDKYKKQYFSNINLIMNNNCNMACDYCYANKGSYDLPGVVLDFESAKKVIDSIEEIRKKNNGSTLHITFFGGEPLLQFSLIKEIINYTKNLVAKDVRIKWDIVTNGTLINDDIANLFEENDFTVTISIDGPKNIHDKSRKFVNGTGTFEAIISNILTYKDRVRYVVRLTINDNNTDVMGAIREIRKYGVNRFVFGLDNGISENNFTIVCNNIRDLFEEYKKSIINHDYFLVDNINKFILNIALRRKSKYHCSSGIAYFALSADSKIYLCHRFVGIEEQKLLDIDNNFYENIQLITKRNIEDFKSNAGERVEECNNCSLMNLCGGVCFYNAYKENSNIFSRTHKDCTLKRTIMTSTLKLLTMLSLEDRRDYLLYIKKYNTYK